MNFKFDKRIIAAVGALGLAVLGIIAMLAYANSARDDVFAGAETIEVLQVVDPIPAGTSGEAIGDRAESVKLPRAAVPADALTTVNTVRKQVTKAPLVPGEILLKGKFGSASSGSGKSAQVDLPTGLQEIVITLDRVRAVDGLLTGGQKVGIVASYAKTEIDGAAEPESNFAVNGVLVLSSSAAPATTASSNEEDPQAAPTDMVQVRLAVSAADAVKITHAMEFGRVWLTRQNAEARTARGTIGTEDVVR